MEDAPRVDNSEQDEQDETQLPRHKRVTSLFGVDRVIKDFAEAEQERLEEEDEEEEGEVSKKRKKFRDRWKGFFSKVQTPPQKITDATPSTPREEHLIDYSYLRPQTPTEILRSVSQDVVEESTNTGEEPQVMPETPYLFDASTLPERPAAGTTEAAPVEVPVFVEDAPAETPSVEVFDPVLGYEPMIEDILHGAPTEVLPPPLVAEEHEVVAPPLSVEQPVFEQTGRAASIGMVIALDQFGRRRDRHQRRAIHQETEQRTRDVTRLEKQQEQVKQRVDKIESRPPAVETILGNTERTTPVSTVEAEQKPRVEFMTVVMPEAVPVVTSASPERHPEQPRVVMAPEEVRSRPVERVLHDVEDAAEKGEAIESLYEKRHEVKDADATINAQEGGTSTTPQSVSTGSTSMYSSSSMDNSQRHAGITTDKEEHGLYKQAATNGAIVALILLIAFLIFIVIQGR